MNQSTRGPKARYASRLQLVCPTWLKEKLEAEADSLERPVAELVRERLAAPYRQRQRQ